MARGAELHDEVFARIRELAADHVRYLHWDPFELSYPLKHPPSGGKTSWDFSGIDPYVEDFMAASAGHDAVINFAPMYTWGTNATGFIDPTGAAAGEYFSRIISWYTKGGFVDELGARHVSNYSYNWKYWEVLNEVDAGSSGTRCSSLNSTANALRCAEAYTRIYDGIVTVLHRDHPELQFTGLVLAWPDCAGSEQWFRYFLNASNHRSPVRENFGTYVSEISYHWYSENTYHAPPPVASWWTIGANPADVFVQSAQFVAAARRVQALVDELAPGVRVYCNEVGVLATDPPPGYAPFGADKWWWNLAAAQYGYVYGALAEIGVDAIAASQLTAYPGNAAAISMLDWNNGLGNAWYWVLKMFADTLGSDPKDVHRASVNGVPGNATVRPPRPGEWWCTHSMGTTSFDASLVDVLYAQAFTLRPGRGNERVILLVNPRNSTIIATVAGAGAGSIVRVVDQSAGFLAMPYATRPVPASGAVNLGGFAVALVLL